MSLEFFSLLHERSSSTDKFFASLAYSRLQKRINQLTENKKDTTTVQLRRLYRIESHFEEYTQMLDYSPEKFAGLSGEMKKRDEAWEHVSNFEVNQKHLEQYLRNFFNHFNEDTPWSGVYEASKKLQRLEKFLDEYEQTGFLPKFLRWMDFSKAHKTERKKKAQELRRTIDEYIKLFSPMAQDLVRTLAERPKVLESVLYIPTREEIFSGQRGSLEKHADKEYVRSLKEHVRAQVTQRDFDRVYSFEKLEQVPEEDVLVIIDMQDGFIRDDPGVEELAQDIDFTTDKIIKQVLEMKKKGKPIVLVEWKGCGQTVQKIRDAIGDYPHVKTIYKDRRSVLRSDMSTNDMLVYLGSIGAKSLRVAGTNEIGCASGAIIDFVAKGYTVTVNESQTTQSEIVTSLYQNGQVQDPRSTISTSLLDDRTPVFSNARATEYYDEALITQMYWSYGQFQRDQLVSSQKVPQIQMQTINHETGETVQKKVSFADTFGFRPKI